MQAMFYLGVWEIVLILAVLLTLAAVVAGAVVLAVLLTNRQKRRAEAAPPFAGPPPSTDPAPSCPRCGATLPPGAPQGLCPRCVMGVGMATETEPSSQMGPHGTRIVRPAQADIARRFPHLEILECLGQGGMGVVYKVRQPQLNRLVALKVLAPEKGADPQFAGRFLREAQTLARLSHPHIVTVYDFGEADGMFYLLMEYVEGVTLRQLLREGRIKPEEALTIVPPICEALQFAHEQGVVHRDIKPENILLDKQGRVKIADFGIAKLVGPETPQAALTQERSVIGTPHYMAPEQVEKPGLVDHRADIYSLGVVFYEMLTGELPLGKFQPPSKKVQVDVRLDEIVLHALEKEPNRRYQKASQVKTDVETIRSGPESVGLAEGQPLPEVLQGSGPAKAWARGPAGSAPRFSRTAIAGAVWAPLFFLVALSFVVIKTVEVGPGSPPPGPAWWQVLLAVVLLPLGLTAPFGTTILGGVAISQIRHSRGRLYGLGLAVFDVLLFPLLIVNGLLIAGWWYVAHALQIPLLGSTLFHVLLFGVIVASCVAVTFFVVRFTWRAANKPLSGHSAGHPTDEPVASATDRAL